MCLYIKQDAVAEISETPITVYKVLTQHTHEVLGTAVYKSPFYRVEYQAGQHHVSELSTRQQGDHYSWEGLKDYECLTMLVDGYVYHIRVVEKGLHTFANLEEARQFAQNCLGNRVVMECEIPKGTSYYEGAWTYQRYNESNYVETITVASYASSSLDVKGII